METDAIHYLPKLPFEIRCLIWELCLPQRIVEEDASSRRQQISSSVLGTLNNVPKRSTASHRNGIQRSPENRERTRTHDADAGIDQFGFNMGTAT